MPDDRKAGVQIKPDEFVAEFLKPDFIEKPPKNYRWNYITVIHAKWHRSFFYFITTFRGPRGITTTIEAPFTQLEFVGNRPRQPGLHAALGQVVGGLPGPHGGRVPEDHPGRADLPAGEDLSGWTRHSWYD
ncbi:MAG: hypothetical protein K2R98_11850 [Gemmataceae bacterium]|nr:hypothetical protein [Gemmataceae bacterium]